ncbi:hypothetical protein D3C85_1465580 [compost metagenome]
MAEGIEPRHAGNAESHRTGQPQTEIDQPQVFRGIGQPWRQSFFFEWSGHFRLIKLGATDTQQRQHGHG